MRSIIISAGKYAEVYLAFFQESGIEIVGFLDDDPALARKKIHGIPVLGGFNDLEKIVKDVDAKAVYCPLGDNKLRTKMLDYARSLGLKTPNYIHPTAHISPHVKIGQAVYILLGANIMPFTEIEDDVMISMNVNLAHHCILRKGTFLSTGVNFGASIEAKPLTYVGIGSTIMTGIKTLGKDCLVGAGAVVIHDVPDYAVVAGVPAKVIKYLE